MTNCGTHLPRPTRTHSAHPARKTTRRTAAHFLGAPHFFGGGGGGAGGVGGCGGPGCLPSVSAPAAEHWASCGDITPLVPTAPTILPSATSGRPPSIGVTPGSARIDTRPPA